MCTWAYAWFASRPNTDEYVPFLFLVGMIADASMVIALAKAFGHACK